MSSNEAKELIEELSSIDNINILKIKRLCSNKPGLIASISGLRLKIWTLLLLGKHYQHNLNINSDNSINQQQHQYQDCKEQQVLDADVPRTRSDIEEFRSTLWRSSLHSILYKFCISHNIQYKQGMNEILAPFLFISPPPMSIHLPYSLFEAFLFRYLERFMCVDDSYHLFKAFRMFHLLLMYYDPQLALHLHQQDFPPELYSPQWFLTLYSRSLPLPLVLRLWDMFIAIDDPAFTFFIGLCLLIKNRYELLLVTRELIPEVIMKLQLFTVDNHGDEIMDQILQQAKELYRSTPRLFLRYLRLCCVSTTELMPQPMKQQPQFQLQQQQHQECITYKLNIIEFDKNLAIQSARVCFMLSTQELIDYLLPQQQQQQQQQQQYSNSSTSSNNSAAATAEIEPTNGNKADEVTVVIIDEIYLHQWVIIDIRSHEDSIENGSGNMPRAIQIEPDFLEKPDAFDIWLQHFDGLKGCDICIIDLPPTNWSGVTLWRRLLLGEGDNSSSNYTSSLLSSSSSSSAINASARSNSNMNRSDSSSRYHEDESAIAQYDMTRPAVQFALALQSNAFPNVCVLDGGFPALVEHLMLTKGTVEPVIINHDENKWKKFLKSSGRLSQSALYNSDNNNISNITNKMKKIVTTSNKKDDVNSNNCNFYKSERPRSVKDLTKLELYKYALDMAERLNHRFMKTKLDERIDQLQRENKNASYDNDDEDNDNDDISDECMNITDNIIYPIDSNSNIDDIINASSSSVSMIGSVNSDHNTIPDGI